MATSAAGNSFAQRPGAECLSADLEMLDKPTNALPILDQCLVATPESGLCWFDAELHRRRGLLPAPDAPTDFDAAASAFQTARSVPRARKARTYELLAGLLEPGRGLQVDRGCRIDAQ